MKDDEYKFLSDCDTFSPYEPPPPYHWYTDPMIGFTAFIFAAGCVDLIMLMIYPGVMIPAFIIVCLVVIYQVIHN